MKKWLIMFTYDYSRVMYADSCYFDEHDTLILSKHTTKYELDKDKNIARPAKGSCTLAAFKGVIGFTNVEEYEMIIHELGNPNEPVAESVEQ